MTAAQATATREAMAARAGRKMNGAKGGRSSPRMIGTIEILLPPIDLASYPAGQSTPPQNLSAPLKIQIFAPLHLSTCCVSPKPPHLSRSRPRSRPIDQTTTTWIVRKRKKGRPRHPSPPRPPKSEEFRLVGELGNGGIISLLFESPSGFAIFKFDGVQLFRSNAMEIIWLKEFKTFKNKANVFSHTGVNKELAAMIQRCLKPGQLLAVEKQEHREIIEAKLGITCVCNDAMLEVMWGIKNILKSLLPLEDTELSKEERLYMSHGMKNVLIRHGFNDVTPEMVNEQIIKYACVLYDCDLCETKHSSFLASCGRCLMERSGIDYEGWSTMKLATALKILCFPDDDESYDDLNFSRDELGKLRNDGSEYDGILLKRTCMSVYSEP
ncbi:uncharacterized protein [Miscanthus floridulus]|uniref:uncharacterized protein n=1 Tax=Miscanthus floridulus TaxID=154761 RepID=UPI00345B4537